MSYLELSGVGKIYTSGTLVTQALRNVSFSAEAGELVVILGSSGAGKTTLLNLLGGMDSASDGKIVLDGRDITSLDRRGLCDYRRRDVGFVFQFYNLMPNLTALENVEIAVEICKDHLDPERVLRDVGLGERLANFPAQLSGGEQQRVSIARAIAKNPKILLCDEPTGALDYRTGKTVLSLLDAASRRDGRTVIIVTHNQAIAGMADRVIRLRSGTVESVSTNPAPLPAERIEW